MGKLTISMAIFKSYETNYQRVLTEQVLTSPVRWSQGQAKKTERSRIAAEVPDCAAYCWLAIPQRCCLDQPCSVLSHYREAPFNIRVNSSLELASSDHPRSIHRNFKLIELNPIVDPHEILKKSSWNHQEIIMKSSSKPVLSSRLLTNFSRLVQLFQSVCFHRLEAQGNLPVWDRGQIRHFILWGYK